MNPLSLLALAWGFAEATAFFIVPDVCLSFIVLYSPQTAWQASLYCLVGATLGGCIMHAFGRRSPRAARSFLTRVPAISSMLVQQVASRIDARGWLAIVLGPLQGTPYKIYAVEWGARGECPFLFALISIPARYPRFAITILAATLLRPYLNFTLLVTIWLLIYFLYFRRFRSVAE